MKSIEPGLNSRRLIKQVVIGFGASLYLASSAEAASVNYSDGKTIASGFSVNF